MLIPSGKVLFYLIGSSFLDHIRPQPFIDKDTITSIHVPLQVTMHKNWDCYHWFPNLLEIIAHPESSKYITYDGALYSKRGTLLYVPRGKKTIRLAPFLNDIDYRAFWNHENLEEIFVDSANDLFCMQHGCLSSKNGRSVYFVANQERTLYISATTVYISEDVFSQNLCSIIIEKGNPYFEVVNGMLIRDGQILYNLNSDNICIPRSVTKITTETASKLFGSSEKRTVTAIEHPVFQVENNALFNKMTKEMLFLSPWANSLIVPYGYSLGVSSLYCADNLEEISVPIDIVISKNVFRDINNISGKNYNRKIMNRTLKSITVRWPDGKSCTFPGEIIKSIHTIQKKTVEVKSGTEILYLELFLAGKITSPEQKRNFSVSIFQILTYLIDNNDLERFRRVLDYGGLVTSKNYSRLRKYAQDLERREIVRLLDEAIE